MKNKNLFNGRLVLFKASERPTKSSNKDKTEILNTLKDLENEYFRVIADLTSDFKQYKDEGLKNKVKADLEDRREKLLIRIRGLKGDPLWPNTSFPDNIEFDE